MLHYNTVSRVTATMTARWLRVPCLGYFDDFGIVAAESAIRDALRAFTALNDILSGGSQYEASD